MQLIFAFILDVVLGGFWRILFDAFADAVGLPPAA